MSESLYSPSWYRVADLKPRLRRHLQIRRHRYRDETWFVLQDYAAGKAHRLKGTAANLGATALRKAALSLEKAAKADDPAKARAVYPELVKAADQLKAYTRTLDWSKVT